jgi:hypothetical protein
MSNTSRNQKCILQVTVVLGYSGHWYLIYKTLIKNKVNLRGIRQPPFLHRQLILDV